MSGKKGENLSNSTSSCEKVFTAIICCSCQTNQDASDHEHGHMPATSGPEVPAPTRDVHAASQKAEVAEKKGKLELQTKEVDEKGPTKHVAVSTEPDEGKRSGLAKSDTFSDYIHRVKMKIRTMSNIDHGKNASKADDAHDYAQETKKDNNSKDSFSDYINRAKMKIRKTSSFGSKKDRSLKRE